MLAGRFGWGEAIRLADALAADPSSHVCAALNGWQYPIDRSTLAVADLFDLTVAMNTPKGHTPKRYPRPWDPPPKRLGDPSQHSQETVIAALRARGHGIPATPPPRRDKAGRYHDARGRFCPAPP